MQQKIVLGLFIMVLASPSLACDFCTPVVLLNDARAKCFLEIYPDRVARLEESGRGFVEINLESCAGAQVASDKSVVSPPLDPDFDGGAKIYLDAVGMSCMRQLILENQQSFNPQKRLSLIKSCSKSPVSQK